MERTSVRLLPIWRFFMAKVDYRAVLRLQAKGLSRRQIAASLGCSRDSVARVLNRAEKKDFAWDEAEALSAKDVEKRLFPERSRRGDLAEPDLEHVHAELAKPKVTLTLLHEEYREQCAKRGEMSYCYSQFCNKYRDFTKRTKATMRLIHKPGDVLEVDWAGTTLTVHDEHVNVARKAYLFVACLPYSQLVYAEAFPDMKSDSWITANVRSLPLPIRISLSITALSLCQRGCGLPKTRAASNAVSGSVKHKSWPDCATKRFRPSKA